MSAFERAVALEPTSSLYHMWLGHAYTRQLSSAGFLRKPFIAVPSALTVVIIVATFVPARRAAHLDAVAALRNE